MKTNLILITSLSAIFAGVSAVHAASYISTVESTPNLLGYWRFSTASQANSEVNGYTGTFNGGAAVGSAGSGPTLAVDPSNSAVVFNGSTRFVNTNLTGQVVQDASIVGWFNLAALPSLEGHIFYIAGESQVGDDFDLQIGTDDRLRFYYTAGGNTGGLGAPFTSAALGAWHFFAATMSPTASHLYLDGALLDSAGGSNRLANSAPFTMGESSVFTGRLFDGRLDEIALYNRELTPTEVSNIYASRSVVPEPSTTGLLFIAFAFAMAHCRNRKCA